MFYKCPSGEKEQISLGSCHREEVYYETDISTGEARDWNKADVSDSELLFYYCPECGTELDNKFVKALNIKGLPQ